MDAKPLYIVAGTPVVSNVNDTSSHTAAATLVNLGCAVVIVNLLERCVALISIQALCTAAAE